MWSWLDWIGGWPFASVEHLLRINSGDPDPIEMAQADYSNILRILFLLGIVPDCQESDPGRRSPLGFTF
jgi:hypothetical protein